MVLNTINRSRTRNVTLCQWMLRSLSPPKVTLPAVIPRKVTMHSIEPSYRLHLAAASLSLLCLRGEKSSARLSTSCPPKVTLRYRPPKSYDPYFPLVDRLQQRFCDRQPLEFCFALCMKPQKPATLTPNKLR
jgi:hypothetical protein